jgi:hypothetical protein
MKLLFSLLTLISFVAFAMLSAWIVIAHLRPKILDLQFGVQQHTMVCTGGVIVRGVSGYFLRTDRNGVILWNVEVTPVIAAPGPDGRPSAGLFDPLLQSMFRCGMKWLIAGCVASAVLPTIWFFRRPRQYAGRGFPIDQRK